jgi:hypothetical protein
MVLYGAYGSGKTRLLVELEKRLREAGIVCARADRTRCLDDIVRAVEEANSSAGAAEAVSEPSLQHGRDLRRAVLLLDHVTDVSNSMVRFLRRLYSDMTGVLSAVDSEVEREKPRLRAWRLGALSIRMPNTSAELLHRLLEKRSAELQLPQVDPNVQRHLIHAAQGRPKWILECAERQADPRYRHGEQLSVSQLCEDTEATLQRELFESLSSDDSFVTADHGVEGT